MVGKGQRMTCQYCNAPDFGTYDSTCLPCTASLMAPMTDTVIAQRVQIERESRGDQVADALRDAIAERRK